MFQDVIMWGFVSQGNTAECYCVVLVGSDLPKICWGILDSPFCLSAPAEAGDILLWQELSSIVHTCTWVMNVTSHESNNTSHCSQMVMSVLGKKMAHVQGTFPTSVQIKIIEANVV